MVASLRPCGQGTHNVDFGATGKVHGLRGDGFQCVHDNRGMAEDGAHNLKAWRKHRRMTQQELADKVEPPTTKSVIAALENGQNGLSEKWLRRLAPALGTTAGRLLEFAPDDVDSQWSEATGNVPPDQRPRAIRLLKALSDRD